MVKIRGVEIEHAIRWVLRGIGSVQNYVERFAASQRDRVREVVEVVSCLVAQQLGIDPDDMHRNAKRSQGLIFRNIQVGDAEESFAASRNVDDRGQRLRVVLGS